MSKLVHASDMSEDPELAQWLFDNAVIDAGHYSADPLTILLQRELEQEQDDAEYPYLAPSTTCN